MKLTPWFSGDTKPVRPGVYERLFSNGCSAYSRWNGSVWFRARSTPEDAASREIRQSPFQRTLKWRGVLKE